MNTKEWAEEWAEKLTGREYCEEMNAEERKQAAADGVIIIFGSSDDLMEFRGQIDDEVSAYGGNKVRLTNQPAVFEEEKNTVNQQFNRVQIACMPTVTAVWCPRNENGKIWASWEIRTRIPHETFDIMEDGTIYCRGAVFDAAWLLLDNGDR